MPETEATIVIRDAVPDDAATLLQLVRDLAAFERAADAVRATEADFRRDGFGPQRRFEARLALVDGRPAGFTLFYPSWSTWEGRAGLYLEDLFVAEWSRRLGLGRRLMQDLAAIAVARNWTRFDFSVLAWNPARDFYHALGFAHRDEWLRYRMSGAALERFAAGKRPEQP
jgi:GNAT superfamily N-acetyltransferase